MLPNLIIIVGVDFFVGKNDALLLAVDRRHDGRHEVVIGRRSRRRQRCRRRRRRRFGKFTIVLVKEIRIVDQIWVD